MNYENERGEKQCCKCIYLRLTEETRDAIDGDDFSECEQRKNRDGLHDSVDTMVAKRMQIM